MVLEGQAVAQVAVVRVGLADRIPLANGRVGPIEFNLGVRWHDTALDRSRKKRCE